jgi:hypothetical protein
MEFIMHQCRKVVLNKFGKLAPGPDFPNQGCYFFTIPEEHLERVQENKIYLFKFLDAKEVMDKETNAQKVDKRGKLIYNRYAIPLHEMPFTDEKEANDFFVDVKRICHRERF